MSVSSTGTRVDAAHTPAAQRRVRWRDLIWIGWRQHRLMLTATAAIALVGALLIALVATTLANRGGIDTSVLFFDNLARPAALLEMCILGYSVVVAVFWAAPLLAKEYEQRTHLFVWSQDVSALRWLAGKTVLLATTAVAFALLLGAMGNVLLYQFNAVATDASYPRFEPFDTPYFGAVPLVQAGYALFGFALGLALSALCRRTVLSMGLTLVTFIVVRGAVAGAIRPHYQSPVRETHSLRESDAMWSTHEHSMHVSSGYLDTAGNTVEYPHFCDIGQHTAGDYQSCLAKHDIVGSYVDYQPIERLGTFHLIEFGLFTALALLLFAVTWRLLRRTSRL